MSKYVQMIDSFGDKTPHEFTFRNSQGEALTYGELKACSDKLASYIVKTTPVGTCG
ncbi:MAG: hypothetical protein ACOYD7_08520 [Raoultibacter sp.]